MGKFINTEYKETVQSISDFGKSLLKNQYYAFNDKRGIAVINYWNINKNATSLDPGSLLEQDDIGEDSPIRYNYIEGVVGYGFPRIELDMNNGDFGLESEPIRGEWYLLPNTFTPCEGDFFEIPFIYDGPWLFKIMKVGRDTLENGANVFKLEFVLDRTTNEEIKQNTVGHYVYLDIQDGTNIRAIVENKKYQFAKKLDDTCSALKGYYTDLFFSEYVQTFVVEHVYETKLYDPFLIEFIIRNQLMQDGDSYVSVAHQTTVPRTFAIDYNESIFAAFEQKSVDKISNGLNFWYIKEINELSSIFHTRFERYFSTVYNRDKIYIPSPEGSILDQELIYRIESHNLYMDLDCKRYYENIIVKYFYDDELTDDDINTLDRLDYAEGSKIFYMIPILIFCLESYTKKLLR